MQTAEDISHQYITMEGLMEKLPMNKKKSTLLKTWKRRFFRAKDGWVAYFEVGGLYFWGVAIQTAWVPDFRMDGSPTLRLVVVIFGV